MKRENSKTGRFSFILFSLLSLLFLLSCGLDEVLFIDSIPDGMMTDNTSASIRLPSPSSDNGYSSYFSRFVIYYRIYISGEALSGLIDTSSLRSQINSSLNSDYQSLYSLTDKTNASANPSNLENTFVNRNYFKLELEEDSIENVLGSGSMGQMLEIRFSPVNGQKPVLIMNGAAYTLWRAVSGPSREFRPEPNRYFLNHYDLYDTSKAINEINADTATNSRTTPELRYTYVSMYIFAIGKDYITTIYSQPTHLGIFRLPEAF